MAKLSATISFAGNAETVATNPGPFSMAISAATADILSVDLAEMQTIETAAASGSGAITTKLVDGHDAMTAAGSDAWTPGTVGCYIYLKNNSTTTGENIYIAIVSGSLQAGYDSSGDPEAVSGTDSPTAPTGPDANTTGMTETDNKTLRTLTLLPGEFAWFPWDYTGDIYHEAATGTPQLEYWRFDRA